MSGESYGFTVKAFNFNGEGEESTVAYFKPCTVPSNLAEPEILETTRSSISFKWTAPEDNGACPIEGYVLYLDEGVTGSAFSPVDEDVIADKDYLRTHTVSFDASEEGLIFRYILEAKNEIGSVQSSIGVQLLAGVPGKPEQPPVSDPAVTNGERIKVVWLEPLDDGGSDI